MTRRCIKCNRELPLGMFDDNWRHKTNICKSCKDKYNKEYKEKARRIREQRHMAKLSKEIEILRAERR